MQELDHLTRERETSLNDLYEALANDRRRAILATLREQTMPVDTATLAQYVAEAEHGVPDAAVHAEAVEQVHISLYHVHLPRLAASGLVEYDHDRDAVLGVADEVQSLKL